MLHNRIKEIIDGMSSEVPFCNAMSELLGRIFSCEYVFIFIFNIQSGKLTERVIRTLFQLPHIDFRPGFTSIELIKSAAKSPFYLDVDTRVKLGLNPTASVIVASSGENQFLHGAVAISKDNGIAWDRQDLERLSIITMLFIRCFELSVNLLGNQQYASTIVESAETAIMAINTKGIILHFNHTAEEIFGIPVSEAIGEYYAKLSSPKEREMTIRTFEYVLKTGKTWESQIGKFARRDNTLIFVSASVYPWLNGDGDIIGAIVIVRDDTETKRFQEQLLRSERMAILGQFANQVSHDMQSHLASIKEFALSVKAGDTYSGSIDDIVGRIDNMNVAVQELLYFGKQEEVRHQKIDINQAIKKAMEFLAFDRNKVEIIENYDENLPCIEGDHNITVRIFMNLLENAYQSLKDSGTINISTSRASGNLITVAINDTGCGIPVQFIRKIFDPYFTTEYDRTGLGLTLVQKFVKNQGGKIKVKSNVGIGTCFQLEIPISKIKSINLFSDIDSVEDMTKSIEEVGISNTLKDDRAGEQRVASQNESNFDVGEYEGFGIIGHSPLMADIYKLLKKVACLNTTVLITGESGTGKSLLARVIHRLSSRSQYPFVTIDCAVLPETLMESELFGHEKGAFTGAISAKIGKFEVAEKGTVFLDEIGTLSLQTQAKLLRVIQDKKFEKVGGVRSLDADVRVIAATNENLEEVVASGKFREDLFYRLNVFVIAMPSLCDRKEDIQELTKHFIKKVNNKLEINIRSISSEAMGLLLKYPWPGNIRELENVIERAMIMADGVEIGSECLPAHFRPSAKGNVTSETKKALKLSCADNLMVDLEKSIIIEALEKTNGHRAKAANLLGISRRVLQYKLKKYGMLKSG